MTDWLEPTLLQSLKAIFSVTLELGTSASTSDGNQNHGGIVTTGYEIATNKNIQKARAALPDQRSKPNTLLNSSKPALSECEFPLNSSCTHFLLTFALISNPTLYNMHLPIHLRVLWVLILNLF